MNSKLNLSNPLYLWNPRPAARGLGGGGDFTRAGLTSAVLLVDNMTHIGADVPRMSYSRYCSHGNNVPQFSRRNGFLSPTAKYHRDVNLYLIS